LINRASVIFQSNPNKSFLFCRRIPTVRMSVPPMLYIIICSNADNTIFVVTAGAAAGAVPVYQLHMLKETASLIRTVQVIRYVTPLREGGSLPAIAEADDGFLYVIKFRGAGQAPKSLIAELIGGEIARALGLKVPEIVFAGLDTAFGRTEPA